MKNLDLQKIEIKKTKINLVLESECKNNEDEKEAFKKLLAISLLSGVSGNCFRQVSKEKLTKTFDFDRLHILQDEMNILIQKMMTEIDRSEKIDGIKYESITFK